MTQKLEIYKCSICGNIVEVLHTGASALVCCGEEMKLLAENSVDAAKEKHYIEWIELIADNKSYLHFLKPGEAPEATFPLIAKKVTAREYCNLHGQWKSEN
jgi:superoxide reductase